jgi:hypothetical protein
MVVVSGVVLSGVVASVVSSAGWLAGSSAWVQLLSASTSANKTTPATINPRHPLVPLGGLLV